MNNDTDNLKNARFDSDGLIPAVIQDGNTQWSRGVIGLGLAHVDLAGNA